MARFKVMVNSATLGWVCKSQHRVEVAARLAAVVAYAKYSRPTELVDSKTGHAAQVCIDGSVTQLCPRQEFGPVYRPRGRKSRKGGR